MNVHHYRQEVLALTMRWVRRLSREKFSMLFTLVQPMLFWLLIFSAASSNAPRIFRSFRPRTI